MSYFSNFDNLNLKVKDFDISYPNIFKMVDVYEKRLKNQNIYQYTTIKQYERPDNVSYRLYGDSDYYWTFFILNDFLKSGMKEWALSDIALDQFNEEKYGKYTVLKMKDRTALTLEGDLLSNDLYFDLMEPQLDAEGFISSFDLLNSPEDNIYRYAYPMIYGLDLSYEYLKVKRTGYPKSSGKIHKFESQLEQLWLEEITDDFLFQSVTIDLELIEHESNLDWLWKAARDWYPYYYDDNFEFTDENIADEILPKLVFEVEEYYTNPILAFHSPSKTIYEYESELNEYRRRIKVVKPGDIYSFVSEFRNALGV